MTRILVIDDEEPVRFTLREILESENYEVTVAINGVEGTALFKEQPFPVVITDIFMPEKDGLETILELKKDHPNIKIIAISGGGNIGLSQQLEVARQLGADHAITKPFGTDEVLDCVKECLAS